MKVAAIRLAMLKPSPQRIPLSGNIVYKRDYFLVYLGDRADRQRFVVLSADGRATTGLWFNRYHEDGAEASVKHTALPDLDLNIIHYAHELEIEFTSALEFLAHQLFGIDGLKVLKERTAKRLFDRTPLIRAERIRILKIIAEETLTARDFSTSSFGLMQILHSLRAFSHPNNAELICYYDIILDSLRHSGDLIEQSGRFTLHPKALATIAQHEQEERIHSAEMNRQTALVLLTAVLAAIGAIQLFDKFAITITVTVTLP